MIGDNDYGIIRCILILLIIVFVIWMVYFAFHHREIKARENLKSLSRNGEEQSKVSSIRSFILEDKRLRLQLVIFFILLLLMVVSLLLGLEIFSNIAFVGLIISFIPIIYHYYVELFKYRSFNRSLNFEYKEASNHLEKLKNLSLANDQILKLNNYYFEKFFLLLRWALFLEVHGKYDQALEKIQQSIELKKNLDFSWEQLFYPILNSFITKSKILHRLNRNEESKKSFEEALELVLDTYQPLEKTSFVREKLHDRVSEVLEHIGRPYKTTNDFDRFVKIYSRLHNSLGAEGLVYEKTLRAIHSRKENSDKELIEKAQTIEHYVNLQEKTEYTYLLRLARLLEDQWKFEEAIKCYLKILDLENIEAELAIIADLAKIQIETGKFEDAESTAIILVNRIQELGNDDYQNLYFLISTLDELGEYKLAYKLIKGKSMQSLNDMGMKQDLYFKVRALEYSIS